MDDSPPPAADRGLSLARPKRGVTLTRALLGVGLVLLAWGVRGRWPRLARSLRRRARWA